MKEIFELGGIKYRATQHFVERFRERFLGEMKLESIKRWLSKSEEVIRKTNPKLIIKHGFTESKYFYYKNADCVLVLIKDRKTGKFDILQTAYKGSDCKWLKRYNDGK